MKRLRIRAVHVKKNRGLSLNLNYNIQCKRGLGNLNYILARCGNGKKGSHKIGV